MQRRTVRLILLCVFLSVTLLACAGAGRQEKGTGVGAATGAGIRAILGQAIGKDTKGTLIGAGAGAIVGAVAGNQVGKYMDNQEREMRKALDQQKQASIHREKEILRATFNENVFFDFDSAELKEDGKKELDRVAKILNKYRKTMILVEGHTDKTGSNDYNQKLSERRAKAV